MMDAPDSIRLDKWLWVVRIFKTRTQAAEACRRGGVQIGGQKMKPSHCVRRDEIISAKTGDIVRTVKVLVITERRVGASVVKEFMEDLTPPEEYQKLREPYFRPLFQRKKGTGRPTKKERREFEQFTDQ